MTPTLATTGRGRPTGEGEIDQARREILRLREALARARRDARRARAAKAAFFRAVSHELCTPLNAIVGYGDLLELGVAGPMSAAQRAYLARIRKGTRELIELVDRLLTLAPAGPDAEAGGEGDAAGRGARAGEPACERVDATAIADEVIRGIRGAATAKGLEVRVRLPLQPVMVAADPDRLFQILANLLSNAVRFTDRGCVSLRVIPGARHVRFVVRDTGRGIRREELGRIFTPFSRGWRRRAGEGPGLGLAVSRRLARRYGGDIRVRSRPGRGSAFALRLPLARGG